MKIATTAALAACLFTTAANAQAIYSTTSQPYGRSGTQYTTTGSDGSSSTLRVFKDDNGQWHGQSSYTRAPTPSPYNGNYGAKYCPMGGCK